MDFFPCKLLPIVPLKLHNYAIDFPKKEQLFITPNLTSWLVVFKANTENLVVKSNKVRMNVGIMRGHVN